MKDVEMKKEFSKYQYKSAYNILMDYWDYLPDEDKSIIDDRLNKIFNGSAKPPKNCIKNALKRLRDECGYGKSK